MKFLNSLLVIIFIISSTSAQTDVTEQLPIEKIVTDSLDEHFGYYLALPPESKVIKAVLVLLPGFTQPSESVFTDSNLPKIAYQNDILTVAFSSKLRRSVDDIIKVKMDLMFNSIIDRYKVSPANFIIGGFSAGGAVALRYVELCHQYPDTYPITPKGVFMIDSPIDLYYSWELSEQILESHLSEIAFKEAEFAKRAYEFYYGGTPKSHPEVFKQLSPFSMNKQFGQHEKHLKNVAVRAYHDIDISWRIVNRNQTPQYDNFIASAELINRLRLIGNEKAEFIQSFKTGFRNDGRRHPHSWSIVDANDCIKWIHNILK